MPPIVSALRGTARAAAILAILAATTPAFAAGSPTGIWLDDTGRGAIEISSCGKSLCGKVVWVKSARDKSGCGEPILGGVRDMGGGRWDGGWIYSPDHGRKFDVELTPVGTDKLRVLGYASIKMFGETRTWKRAPADLQRCDGKEVAKAPAAASAEPAKPQAAAAAKPEVTAAVGAVAAANPPEQRPSTAPELNPETAKPMPSTPPAETTETESDNDSAPASRNRGIGAGKLAIDKVLKKTTDGRCKLDLPWAKITFDCKEL